MFPAGIRLVLMVLAGRRPREPKAEEEVRRHRIAAILEGEGHGFLQGRCEFAVGLCACSIVTVWSDTPVRGIGAFLMNKA
jgi:hypothetical protein